MRFLIPLVQSSRCFVIPGRILILLVQAIFGLLSIPPKSFDFLTALDLSTTREVLIIETQL